MAGLTRFGVWRRDGLLGALAMHSAALFVFVISITALTLAFGDAIASRMSTLGQVQAIFALILVLVGYLMLEGGLFVLLMRPLVHQGALLTGGQQRQWIAVSILAAFTLATLVSPLTFGAWSLVLPSVPELLVIVFAPMLLRNR